jgi:hypothetical protein
MLPLWSLGYSSLLATSALDRSSGAGDVIFDSYRSVLGVRTTSSMLNGAIDFPVLQNSNPFVATAAGSTLGDLPNVSTGATFPYLSASPNTYRGLPELQGIGDVRILPSGMTGTILNNDSILAPLLKKEQKQ